MDQSETKNVKKFEEKYKSIDTFEMKINIYTPDGWEKDDKRPAIIFFFGGGWDRGSIDQFKPQCLYFSAKGFVTITPDYRVRDRHGTSPFDCVKDGKDSVLWVWKNADRLGIDPNKILVAGGSAGGHIAACTAILTNSEIDKNQCFKIPKAIILFNPVLDTSENGYGFEKLNNRESEISPLDNIKKGIPPTLIFHGTDDTIVPFNNSVNFTQKMLDLGNSCHLIPYKGMNHGFFNKGVQKDDLYFSDTLQKIDEFLISLGYLNDN
jgi:acetyl esterase